MHLGTKKKLATTKAKEGMINDKHMFYGTGKFQELSKMKIEHQAAWCEHNLALPSEWDNEQSHHSLTVRINEVYSVLYVQITSYW